MICTVCYGHLDRADLTHTDTGRVAHIECIGSTTKTIRPDEREYLERI